MRILFISQYYPPEIGAASNRIDYFAQFLSRAGHEAMVLTSAPNYPEGKLYAGYQNRFSIKNENGVEVIRTRIFLTPKSNAITRLAHYLSFVLSSLISRKKIPTPNIILATSPPLFVGLIGVLFKKMWHVPFVLDVRDLWPQSVESVGIVRKKALLRQGEKLAAYIYRNADHITVTSAGIQKGLMGINKPPAITILPNAAELDLFERELHPDHIRKQWSLGERFVVLYTGNLGLAQAPEIFIKTAELLKNQKDIVFLIVGAGVLLPKLRSLASEKNLTNIIFTGVQSRQHMPDYIAASNICVIPYKASEIFRNTLPSKMFDYMAGRKPIIINLKGEASELIETAQCGVTVEEENPKALAAAIIELKENPEVARSMGNAGRAYVEAHFRREVVAEKLEELLLHMI